MLHLCMQMYAKNEQLYAARRTGCTLLDVQFVLQTANNLSQIISFTEWEHDTYLDIITFQSDTYVAYLTNSFSFRTVRMFDKFL